MPPRRSSRKRSANVLNDYSRSSGNIIDFDQILWESVDLPNTNRSRTSNTMSVSTQSVDPPNTNRSTSNTLSVSTQTLGELQTDPPVGGNVFSPIDLDLHNMPTHGTTWQLIFTFVSASTEGRSGISNNSNSSWSAVKDLIVRYLSEGRSVTSVKDVLKTLHGLVLSKVTIYNYQKTASHR